MIRVKPRRSTKIVIDNPNNQIEVSIDVSGTSTEQFVFKDGVIEPTTDNDIDLGSSSKQFKDLHIDGVANVDSIAMPTTTVTDILDEDNMSSTVLPLWLRNSQSRRPSSTTSTSMPKTSTSKRHRWRTSHRVLTVALTFTGGQPLTLGGTGNVTATAAELTLMDGPDEQDSDQPWRVATISNQRRGTMQPDYGRYLRRSRYHRP